MVEYFFTGFNFSVRNIFLKEKREKILKIFNWKNEMINHQVMHILIYNFIIKNGKVERVFKCSSNCFEFAQYTIFKKN